MSLPPLTALFVHDVVLDVRSRAQEFGEGGLGVAYPEFTPDLAEFLDSLSQNTAGIVASHGEAQSLAGVAMFVYGFEAGRRWERRFEP